MNPIALAAFSGWALIAMIVLLWGEIIGALLLALMGVVLLVRWVVIVALYLWAWSTRKAKAA